MAEKKRMNNNRKMFRSEGKKGLSPVIATILLVAIVVVLALLIFLWLRNFVPEIVEKNGEDISIVCERVQFTPVAEKDGTTAINIEISNDGNIPIQDMKIKIIEEDGSSSEQDLSALSLVWDDEFGLPRSRVYTDSLSNGAGNPALDVDKTKQIILTPVLRGTTDTGYQDKACKENQYGHELDL